MPIPNTRQEAEEMYAPHLESWPYQPMEVEPGILLRKLSDLYYIYASEPVYPLCVIKALYRDGTITEWLNEDTLRETKQDGSVVITDLRKLQEFPSVPPKIYKRDFKNGANEARSYVSEVGYDRVVRYFNTKRGYFYTYNVARTASYWYGYYSVLKELEDANTK